MRNAPVFLIAAAVLCAASSGAQKPALTHWRVVRDAADSGAMPRITASVGYLTMGGMRRVDVSFASDTDAYALVAHVASDGTLRIVFPATPRGTGYVHAGDTIVVPTFLGGRDSVVTAKNAARLTRGAAADSYDGGASYLFIIASTSPLHMQGMVDGARWATLALDRKELADPRPAIAELAGTFGAGETHSLTYVRATSEISTVEGGHRVGPAAPETFRAVPLSDAFDVSAPPPQYLVTYGTPQWFDAASAQTSGDAYDAGYQSGLFYGYDDAFVSGGWFHGSRIFDGRRHQQDVTCSPLNSNVGLFAPGFPAFGSCNNVQPKYTPAVGLRADQLPSANKAQIVAPAAVAAPAARMSAASERGTTVFMKAPLGGPIPYEPMPGAGFSGEYTLGGAAAAPAQVVVPMNGPRGYSPYGHSGGGYAPRAAAVAPSVAPAGGQMRAVAPHQSSPARAVAPVKH